MYEVPFVESTRSVNRLEAVLPSEDLPRAKSPSTQKCANYLSSPDVDIPGQEYGHIIGRTQRIRGTAAINNYQQQGSQQPRER